MYGNKIFIDIRGWDESNLVGSPHNILRHPDMPRCAFKVLYDHIQNRKNVDLALTRMLMDLAKISHLVFKLNAHEAAINEKQFVVKKDTECEFGQWLYSEEAVKRIGCYPEFKQIKENIHKQIHQLTKNALQCVDNNSCIKNKEKTIENFTKIEETSQKLSQLLDSVFEKYNEKPCN